MIEGSTFMSRSTSRPPDAARSDSLSAATFASVKGGGAGDFRPRHAAGRVVQFAIIRDHFTDEEQAALRRHQPDEVRGDAADVRLREDGVERLELVGGRKHRALDQPRQVRAIGDESVESRQGVRDGLALALVLGERKQGGRVTSGYAGNNGVFLCHAATSDDD